MIISIEKIDGKWRVNGKCYSELDFIEKNALKEFFIDAKIKAIEAGEYESEVPFFQVIEPIKKEEPKLILQPKSNRNDKNKKPTKRKN